MIFKSLFKPKWQHQDAQIRIKAVAALTAQTHSKELAEIAFNDSEAGIRRKALDILNSFQLWQRAVDDKDAQLARVATEKLRLALLNKADFSVSAEEKTQFINQTPLTKLLEELLHLDSDNEQKKAIITRLNKPRVDFDLALKNADDELAMFCYQRLSPETKELERLANKALSAKVKQAANDLLVEQKLAAEKPVQLRKQVNMVLSRLLALKDKSDYEVVKDTGESLVEQWQTLSQQFDIFAEEERVALTEKYQQICQRVDHATQAAKDAWYQAQEAKAANEAKQSLLNQVNDILTTASELINQAAQGQGDNDIQVIQRHLNQAREVLAKSEYQGAEIEDKFNQLAALEISTERLPEFAEQLAEVTRLLSQLAQQSVPTELDELDEKQCIFNQWKTDWQELSKRLALPLPQPLADTYNRLLDSWKQAIHPFQAQQNKSIDRIKAKLRELNRLILNGKYNAAFGLFRKLSEWHDELTEANKQKIERDYLKLQQKVDELAEWREYIAIPRKKELLSEVQSLAESPLDDALSQAKKIRQLRHVWQLLGNINSEEDNQLNTEFDAATEQAFTICRTFYAEQEQQRASNLKAKQAVITQLEEMVSAFESEEADKAALGNTLSKLFKQWNEIGHVDRSVYKKVNQTFFDIYRPLKAQVNAFYKANEDTKQAIIKQAEQIAEDAKAQADFHTAAETLKSLQQQWKDVGFAGAGKDKGLWQRFRSVNDTVFLAREQAIKENKAQQSEVFNQLNNQLIALTDKVESADSLTSIGELSDTLNAFTGTDELTKGQAAKLIKTKDVLLEKLSRKRQTLKTLQAKQKYLNVMDLANAIINEQDIELKLAEPWLSALNEFNSRVADLAEQQQATLKLELLAGVDSPASLQAERMQLQVKLLAEKMNQGDMASVEEQLITWLSLGKPQDTDLFTRVENVVKQYF